MCKKLFAAEEVSVITRRILFVLKLEEIYYVIKITAARPEILRKIQIG